MVRDLPFLAQMCSVAWVRIWEKGEGEKCAWHTSPLLALAGQGLKSGDFSYETTLLVAVSPEFGCPPAWQRPGEVCLGLIQP